MDKIANACLVVKKQKNRPLFVWVQIRKPEQNKAIKFSKWPQDTDYYAVFFDTTDNMNRDEFNQIFEGLNLSEADAIALLGIKRSTYTNWRDGRRRIPAIALTAARMLKFIAENGMGEKWAKEIGLI